MQTEFMLGSGAYWGSIPSMKAHALLPLLVSGFSVLAASPEVRVWETNLVIPTYLAAPPSPVPRFYEGRTYQGAKATFYPYPVQDRLTDIKTNQSYKALFLENQYVQISVLPELGGRIFSAVDKANGYDFFYRQHVIKPALIGMLGAWISGGVEWNVPHHHRATSFSPVDYTIQTNADGSGTIWVGEIELRHRMKWLVGMTLYTDRSYLELTCKMFNRTPFAHPMLFWINTAIHANTNYQVIFPPSTEWAAQHSKPEFASWPIARQTYGGTDYKRGVDISWWKNHPNPVSFFAWNDEDDWFGGYDHGKQAGVIHVADHHVAPGKKFFEWGNGPEGEMWSKVLTDDDGPYLELMAGAWSDNQPDYSWIQPGETRIWSHFWYPIRELSAVKNATREAAVSLEVTDRIARIGINTTEDFKGTRVRLNSGSSVSGMAASLLFERTADISPTTPFMAAVTLEKEIELEQLRLSLQDSTGHEIVAYQLGKPKGTPMPKPVEKPKSPKDYATTDELYFAGQRVEQLYSPSFEAAPYYEEIRRRDPGDYRANTALGILLCKQWRWEDAAKHLSNAIARATANYIRPKDGEALYYMGVALKACGRFDEAFSSFQRATWSTAWRTPSLYACAELECARTNYSRALALAQKAAINDIENPRAITAQTTLLRGLGGTQDALQFARKWDSFDALDFRLGKELYLSQNKAALTNEARQTAIELMARMRGEPQSALELAADYGDAGLWQQACMVLAPLADGRPMNATLSPMVAYSLAFYAEKAGRTNRAAEFWRRATEAIPDLCFPVRWEEESILRRAMEVNAKDAHARYLLGCLLYDNQPENAIKAWEESLKRDDTFALTHRNLAQGYAQQEKNVPKAIASLEKAVELDPKEPRYFYELDVQYEAGGAPVAKRLDLLVKHHKVVAERDDALTREIVLLTVAGRADHALDMLRGRRFRNWEGSSQIHNVYVDACLARGQQRLAAGQARQALRDFEAAFEYPENLEVGRARRAPRTAQIQYLIGTAQEALGDPNQAKAAFEKAVAGKDRSPTESQYFHALALQKLGRGEEAKPIFERLVTAGSEQLTKAEAADYFAKFGEKQSERVRKANAHHLIGLGQLGLGQKAEARAEFKQALELHPAHLGATMMSPK